MQNNIYHLATSISRNIIRSYARRKVANPGIQKRLNLITEREEPASDDINIDELESDFLKLGDVHRVHEKELKDRHEKEKYLIVRQKYFKQNQRNFLSWSDKEQIRFLHQTNPEEWTIEKLSEGFPALPDTIIKIIKGKWQKQNDSKKINHDEAVEKNWELLRRGKLDVPETLNKHLLKFSSRKRTNVDSNKLVVKSGNEIPRQKNEFSSIINSYTELKNSSLNNITKFQNKTKSDYFIDSKESTNNRAKTLRRPKENIGEETEGNKTEDLILKSNNSELLNPNEHIENRNTSGTNRKSSIDKRLTTLGRLKENIAEKIETNIYVSKDEELILKSNQIEMNNSECSTEVNNSITLSNTIENVIKNRHKSHNALITVQKKPNEIKPYPERIIIPKNKFKQGLTYKVSDCYYDDDGEFLYRVPGMK